MGRLRDAVPQRLPVRRRRDRRPHAGGSLRDRGGLHADPFDGDSRDDAIWQLLDHPRIHDPQPASAGAVEDAELDAGANEGHVGDPAHDTADFGDTPPSSGNLRVDYVLPSRQLRVLDPGVFWPARDDPLFHLVGDDQAGTSSTDHRLVWADLQVPGRTQKP